MKAILSFILLLSLCEFPFTSKADSPPCWCKFESVSENGKYIAYVDKFPEDSLKYTHNARWQIRVYEKGITSKLIWSAQYAYDGYRGGRLSDDGQYFVYINQWYYRNYSLFTIYKNGVEINTDALTGRVFKIPKRKLVKTISHYTWIQYGYECDCLTKIQKLPSDKTVLVFKTTDNKIRQIDLDKGLLIENNK